MLILLCLEFIATLAAESNKICLDEGKKTIAQDHVFKAIKVNEICFPYCVLIKY